MNELGTFLTSVLGVSASLGDRLALLAVEVGVVAVVFAAIQAYLAIGQLREARIATARDVQRAFAQTMGSYTKSDLSHVAKTFIVPELSSVDPNGSESHRQVVSTREDAFRVIGKFVRNQNRETKHLLLLADSGMGKSSLLLALHLKAASKGGYFAGLRVAVLPCGLPGVAERISAIPVKHGTLLCLDGFDEDTEAIQDHNSRLASLLQLASGFAAIIISCRTQFFRSDEEIPKRTGVAIVRPRLAGEGSEYLLSKIYIVPFDDERIARYVRRNIGFFHRKRALSVIRQVPDLAVRPMLLATIPTLAQLDPEYEGAGTKFDLFGRMIDGWLEREKNWIDPTLLRTFSEEVAYDLFCNRVRRGAEVMPRWEFDKFCAIHAPSIPNWQLSGRSLLVRNAEGAMKFAHRSILEFFAVCAALRIDEQGDALRPALWSCDWTDEMTSLLGDLFASAQRSDRTVSLFQLELLGVSPSSAMQGSGWSYERASALAARHALGQGDGNATRTGGSVDSLCAYFTTIEFGIDVTVFVEPHRLAYKNLLEAEFATVIWVVFAPLGHAKMDLSPYRVQPHALPLYVDGLEHTLDGFFRGPDGSEVDLSRRWSARWIGIPTTDQLEDLSTALNSKPALVRLTTHVAASSRQLRAIGDMGNFRTTMMTAGQPTVIASRDTDVGMPMGHPINERPHFAPSSVPVFSIAVDQDLRTTRPLASWLASNLRLPNRDEGRENRLAYVFRDPTRFDSAGIAEVTYNV